MTFDIGRLCVKIAGRDAGKTCVVVDVLSKSMVMVDGSTRRKKCNTLHLEPLDQVVQLKKNASHQEVEAELKKLDVAIRTTKPKKAGAKPTQKRVSKKGTPANPPPSPARQSPAKK